MLNKPRKLGMLSMGFAVLLSGCSSTSVELDSAQHAEVLTQDHQTLEKPANIPKSITLSLEQALERAEDHNLDARVSALEALAARDDVTLEQIRALPSVEYSISRTGRSNFSASRSLSVATGDQSLEPSVSSDRYRNLRDITVNWNLIDAANALVNAATVSDRADIAALRTQKVLQNIHRDVYAAYWRAQNFDRYDQETKALKTQAETQIRNIDEAARLKLISKSEAAQRKSTLLQALNVFEDLQNESALAMTELKSLLNVPNQTALKLSTNIDEHDHVHKALLSADLQALELVALYERPEMREAFLEKNISIRETRQEILGTVPGADLFYGASRDSNQFLENETWRNYSIGLVQNVTNLLTLPDRYLMSRKNEELVEARRYTLAAALLAQVHISRHALEYARNIEALAGEEEEGARLQAYAAQKRQHSGLAAKGDVVLARLAAHEKKLQALQAQAAAQDSYAALINTLGYKVGQVVKPADLKAKIQASESSFDLAYAGGGS